MKSPRAMSKTCEGGECLWMSKTKTKRRKSRVHADKRFTGQKVSATPVMRW